MKKVMMVVGVAACVTLVGCKHDEYGPHKVGNKVPPVETVEVATENDGPGSADTTTPGVETPTANVATPDAGQDVSVTTEPNPVKDDNQSVTTVTNIPDEPVKGPEPAVTGPAAATGTGKDAGVTAKPAVEPEFTPYVVRGGDKLDNICRRYKVKKADVLALNPGMDPNKIFVGRTIKLPGNIEAVKAASAVKADAAAAPKAEAAPAATKKPGQAAPAAKREYKPYTGETKEYVVQNGDTIGGIAYSNGLSIRQFKELNGLSGDLIRVGQKVKIPVEKVKSDVPVAVAPVKKEAAKPGPKVDEKKIAEISPVTVTEDKPKETVAVPKPAEPPAVEAVEAPPAAEPTAVVEPAAPVDDGKYINYTVKPNDDLYSVAIKWSITASQLKEINNLVDDTLTPGQILRVPATVD